MKGEKKMSKDYAIKNPDEIKPSKTSNEMRIYSQRPGKVDLDGNILYMTEQSHKDKTDINNIIRKYHKTGIIDHASNIEAQYGDLTGQDFKSMQDLIINANKMFGELPSHIRKRFENDTYKFLEFYEDPNNRDEAIDLGLIRADWTPASDGIGPGEHIKKDENVKETPEPEKPEPETP